VHQWRSQKFSTGMRQSVAFLSVQCPFPFSCPTKSAVQSKNVMTYHTAWMIERTMINSYITKSNTKKLCIFLTGGAHATYATCMATPLLCMRYNAVCTRPYCIDLMNMWAGLGYRRLILVLLQCVNRELEYSSTLISKNNATYLWNVVPLSGLRKISPRRVINRPLTVVCVVNLVRPATDFVSWSAKHLPWCTISSTWWSRRGASC